MTDQYGRNIDYMRISITDRCNLRCRYCMPDGIEKLPVSRILTFEQIVMIAEEASKEGITKIKITGGEPLVRRGCPELIAQLKQLPEIEQVTLTTNGVLLKENLPQLLDAGLDAVNISLDTLIRKKYKDITGTDALLDVLEGIDAAAASGLRVKINVVPQTGINDDELLDLAALAKDRPMDVRFIEMMPIGAGADFKTLSNGKLLDTFKKIYPGLASDHSAHGNGPAVYYKIPGYMGSIGLISAIHGRFCASCNRIRLTSMGQLKPCLCFGDMIDLRPHLHVADPEIRRALIREDIRLAIRRKPEHHRFESRDDVTEKRQMSAIGG